jgi:hypothetical protein
MGETIIVFAWVLLILGQVLLMATGREYFSHPILCMLFPTIVFCIGWALL